MLTQTLKMLFYENDTASLSRVLSVAYFALFAVVTLYLVVKGQSWQNYEVFAAFAGGAGVAGQISNKFINSKYNTVAGSYESQAVPRK